MNELKKGVDCLFIAYVDGLEGAGTLLKLYLRASMSNCASRIKSATACALSVGENIKRSRQTLGPANALSHAGKTNV